MKSPLTQIEVRRLFDYNPETGMLSWKVRPGNRVRIGDVVDSVHSEGYVQVGVNGERRLAHHVIWLWLYGEMPEGDVDHINRVRNDNRQCNLREVDRTENLLNGEYKNETGFQGVMKMPSGRFRAAIHIKRRCTYIGSFDTAEQAHAAYANKHVELYGEKSRFHPKHLNSVVPIHMVTGGLITRSWSKSLISE